jgi:hypothetical protein
LWDVGHRNDSRKAGLFTLLVVISLEKSSDCRRWFQEGTFWSTDGCFGNHLGVNIIIKFNVKIDCDNGPRGTGRGSVH